MRKNSTEGESISEKYSQIWADVSKIYKVIYKDLDRNFQEHNSNLLEYKILKMLHEEGSQAMASIAEKSFVTQAWITGLVDKLEEKGFVVRVRSNHDRRVINVEMTQSGQKFFSEMRVVHEKLLGKILSFIHEDEATQIAKLVHDLGERVRSKYQPTEP